jgi:para-nitrobenzyl esterase
MARTMAEATAALAPDAGSPELLRAQRRVQRLALRHGLVAAMPFGLQYGEPPLPAEADIDRAWEEAAGRVDLMVGRNTREVVLFALAMPPLARALRSRAGGPVVERALIGPLTRRIYGTAADELAERHRRAGGRGCTYLLDWGAPGNPYRGSHGVELPLLLGSREEWEGPVTEGATWEQVDACGRVLRALWADFARHGTLPTQTHPGLIEVRELLPDQDRAGGAPAGGARAGAT